MLCFIIGGSLIVAFNAKFLGGKMFLISFLIVKHFKISSILQTVCVLGYCLFPICLFCIFNVIFSAYLASFVKLLLALWAFLWSVFGNLYKKK